MTTPIAQSMDILSGGRSSTAPFITLNVARSPTVNDLNYKVGQRWIDTSAQNAEWYLLSFEAAEGVVEANWVQLGSGSATTETVSGNTGDVVSPNVDNNIFILGNEPSGITFDGNLSNTLTATLEDIPNSSLLNSSITLIAGSGISITNSPVSLGGSTTISTNSSVLKTLSDDVNTSILPLASNIQLVGHVNQQGGGKFSTVVAGTNLANINPMSSARWVVDQLGFNGTHTTLESAHASASNGDCILVLPGSFNETFTITKNVLYFAYCSQFRGGQQVGNSGKITVSATRVNAGFYGFNFLPSTDFSIDLTGDNSSIICTECFFNGSTFRPLNVTGNNATNLYLQTCSGFLANGIALYSCTLADVWIKDSLITDYNGTPAASTATGGQIFLLNSQLGFPIESIGATISVYNCSFFPTATTSSFTAVTTSASGSASIYNSSLFSGTASTISVGAASVVTIANCVIDSTNANVFTGAGTINTAGNVCINSSGNNVATINSLTVI